MDELYSLIERKNIIYVITLVSRDKRQIVGYDISFDKFRKTLQNLVDSSPKANRYYSDAYPVYSEILYDGLHTSLLKNKSQIYTVEDVNSYLRYYIPSLRRRSKCFFRTIDTMKFFLKSLFAPLTIASAKFNSSYSNSHLFLSLFI